VGGCPNDAPQIDRAAEGAIQDEVRQVGKEIGLPQELIERQPFPGPDWPCAPGGGHPEDLAILREADAIVEERCVGPGVHKSLQSFAVLLPCARWE